MKKKIVVICGPTATGKTDLGIKLAKQFDGEIISADSRQVYKGMDIGTGKDLEKLKEGIAIWLLDVVNPDHQFTVADYVRNVDLAINDIWKRGKLPIIVGGTGLYIKAVIDGIQTVGVPPDMELRKKLESYEVDSLRNELQKIDPQKLESMNESDRNNPRRLVRAIEIASSVILGSETTPESKRNRFWASQNDGNNIMMIGLTAPNEILYKHIDERVDERVKDGVENEIKNLLDKGYSWDNSALGTTIGYSEWKTGNDVISRWKFDEHNYARRQMTWFKKDKRIKWFDICSQAYMNEIEKLTEKWYNL